MSRHHFDFSDDEDQVDTDKPSVLIGHLVHAPSRDFGSITDIEAEDWETASEGDSSFPDWFDVGELFLQKKPQKIADRNFLYQEDFFGRLNQAVLLNNPNQSVVLDTRAGVFDHIKPAPLSAFVWNSDDGFGRASIDEQPVNQPSISSVEVPAVEAPPIEPASDAFRTEIAGAPPVSHSVSQPQEQPQVPQVQQKPQFNNDVPSFDRVGKPTQDTLPLPQTSGSKFVVAGTVGAIVCAVVLAITMSLWVRRIKRNTRKEHLMRQRASLAKQLKQREPVPKHFVHRLSPIPELSECSSIKMPELAYQSMSSVESLPQFDSFFMAISSNSGNELYSDCALRQRDSLSDYTDIITETSATSSPRSSILF